MKIFLVEDKLEDIQGILDYCEEHDHTTEVCQFKDTIARLESFDPDIIILDLQNNTEEYDGCPALDHLWKSNFRPTCVFSGQIVEALIDEADYKSPLVCFVTKGDEKPVIQFIEEIASFAVSISAMRHETNNAMRKSFEFLELAK